MWSRLRDSGLVRAYQPEDRDALINVFVRAIRESAIRDYSPAQVEAWSAVDRANAWSAVGDRLIWVAVAGASVVGFTDLEPSGHLDHMYVHPEHEGRGIASALLTCLEAAARRAKYPVQKMSTLSGLLRGSFLASGNDALPGARAIQG
jgi:putative acetyltransferase